MDFSPAMSDFSNMDDEALDLYLAGCGTLSNLPTPPPPRRQPIMYNEPLTPPPEEDIEFKFDELRGTFFFSMLSLPSLLCGYFCFCGGVVDALCPIFVTMRCVEDHPCATHGRGRGPSSGRGGKIFGAWAPTSLRTRGCGGHDSWFY
jgi:hypothetical protein